MGAKFQLSYLRLRVCRFYRRRLERNCRVQYVWAAFASGESSFEFFSIINSKLTNFFRHIFSPIYKKLKIQCLDVCAWHPKFCRQNRNYSHCKESNLSNIGVLIMRKRLMRCYTINNRLYQRGPNEVYCYDNRVYRPQKRVLCSGLVHTGVWSLNCSRVLALEP